MPYLFHPVRGSHDYSLSLPKALPCAIAINRKIRILNGMITKELQSLFWDTNTETFDPAEYPDYTIFGSSNTGTSAHSYGCAIPFATRDPPRNQNRAPSLREIGDLLVAHLSVQLTRSLHSDASTSMSRQDRNDIVWHPETITAQTADTLRALRDRSLLGSFSAVEPASHFESATVYRWTSIFSSANGAVVIDAESTPVEPRST